MMHDDDRVQVRNGESIGSQQKSNKFPWVKFALYRDIHNESLLKVLLMNIELSFRVTSLILILCQQIETKRDYIP